MRKRVKKACNAITAVLVAVLAALALLLMGGRLLGLQIFTVLSGSMEPAYETGSLIYVKQVDHRELKAGDVITFMLSEDTVATHRIVEVLPDANDPSVIRYRTKGDANNTEDQLPVHYKNILGTPVFTIPKLGYVLNCIQHPPGNYLTIAFAAILLLPACVPEKPQEKKRKKGGKYLRK